jgi:hypothetical protein
VVASRDPCLCGRQDAKTQEAPQRCKCCWDIPLVPNEHGEPTARIADNAALWLRSHRDAYTGVASRCDKCPFCCLFPVLSRLSKVTNHVAALQVSGSERCWWLAR